MMDTHYHHSIDILTTFPYMVTSGGIPQLDIENGIPDLLVSVAAVVDQPRNRGAGGSSPHTYPMVMVIRGSECPVRTSQLLAPLIHRQRCAFNKHHDMRCLVHNEAQHPWFRLSLNRLASKIAKVEDIVKRISAFVRSSWTPVGNDLKSMTLGTSRPCGPFHLRNKSRLRYLELCPQRLT